MIEQIHDFIHGVKFEDAPRQVQEAARIALLDLLGVAAAGTSTQCSQIIRAHAQSCFGSNENGARMLFDGRRCSVPGAALAGGMQIDSVDAHDGHKMTKGHVGCAVLPTALAFSELDPEVSEQELLSRILLGYELGSRAGMALHASVSDYHTSGAWVALACAAIGSRALGLDRVATREALGIAEYHGPRSQMMRTIDHPTMIKDGSGWGAMAGASAALLASSGFTGAPALTMEQAEVSGFWEDLGQRWCMQEQYIKAYPVCRWAQPAIRGVVELQEQQGFVPSDIKEIEVGTFHESSRLAVNEPVTTEQAQYSLPFPVAVAAVHGDVKVAHIDGAGLHDEAVLALSRRVSMVEVDDYNEAFPARRISHVRLHLHDGRVLDSGPVEAAGDPEKPFSRAQVEEKFLALAAPAIGDFGAVAVRDAVAQIGEKPALTSLNALIYQPVNPGQSSNAVKNPFD